MGGEQLRESRAYFQWWLAIMTYNLAELLHLQPLEKLRIISALEDSLLETGGLSDEQKELVRRRHEAHRLDPNRALNWDQFESAINADHG